MSASISPDCKCISIIDIVLTLLQLKNKFPLMAEEKLNKYHSEIALVSTILHFHSPILTTYCGFFYYSLCEFQ
jgi:hypothetical protein